ncbi:hypothetical protein JW835_11735 [bacterium]|nr:hypothetical protein [bacterium]
MSLIYEFQHIKSTKKELKKFGLTVGIGLIVLSGILYLAHHLTHPLLLWQIPAVSVFLALTFPILLWPFQKVWIALSIILGFIMTRIILCILFYLILTPIGQIAKLTGNDFLNLKWDPDVKTYWNIRKNRIKDQSTYENQF